MQKISKPENMQGLGRRSRNLSSNFGSRALSIVSRLQTLTGGEAKTWQKKYDKLFGIQGCYSESNGV